MLPLRNLAVGYTRFLKFPRSSSLFAITSQSAREVLDSTTRKAIEIRSYPSLSCYPYSSSSSSETLKRSISVYSSDFSRKLDVDGLNAGRIKKGFLFNLPFCNHLLNLYVKNGDLVQACKLFDEMPDRDVKTWTIMITAFAVLGLPETSLNFFINMQMEGIYPNCFTLPSIFKCCASIRNIKMGKQIHGWIIRNLIGLDVYSENSIVDFYVKCGNFRYAGRVFELMEEKDTVSWNIMMKAFLERGETQKSIELFKRLPEKDVASWNTIIIGQMRNGFDRIALDLLYQMRESGTSFSKLTFSTALLLVASLSMSEVGKQVHSQLLRTGFYQDMFIRNSLIDMYCKCGNLEKASLIFDEMQCSLNNHSGSMEHIVSLSSIISGYVQNGMIGDAFELFQKMVRKGVELNQFILTSIASACADAGILEQGKQIHGLVEKLGCKFDVFLVSATIDMYTKCGSLDDALSIFDTSSCKNTVTWTSLLSGLAFHGRGREVIRHFDLMLNDGISPNEISFLAVLSGCSHGRLVEEGLEYFRLMKEDYGIAPSVEHYTCMVDLLGRAGKLKEAKGFILTNNISHLSPVWTAFLAACRVHKNVEMGTWASEKLLHFEPNNAGAYLLLSNICTESQSWKKASEVRSWMQSRGFKKKPGKSWIQLKNQVHVFVAGDRSHKQSTEIYSYLEMLIGRLKEVGYSTDTNFITQDVEEEQREVLLGFHSEKLAIAFGIMSTPSGSPIRVMKNLRVCIDCHTAIKCISKVTNREITVRDARRFHLFKNGECSCGDFW